MEWGAGGEVGAERAKGGEDFGHMVENAEGGQGFVAHKVDNTDWLLFEI